MTIMAISKGKMKKLILGFSMYRIRSTEELSTEHLLAGFLKVEFY
ncbi:unnamed protein product, partial [Rotaria sp. Silwood1]